MKLKIMILSLLLILTTVIILVFINRDEKSRIRRRFAKFAENVNRETGEGGFQLAIKAETIKAFFDDECDIGIPHSSLSGIYSPEQIASQSVRLRARFEFIKISFYDFQIELDENKKEAVVILTARFQARLKENRLIDEIRELECELHKRGNRWVFRKFQVIEVLEK